MRKADPQAVRRSFAQDADGLMAFMNRTRRAIEGESKQKADVSQLAEMVFLDLYVSFERFLSDLFLAYLNRDFSQYQAHTEARLRSSVQDRFGNWTESRVRFDRTRHVKVDELEKIVDPDGWNLTFASAQKIKQKARDWLVANHRNRVLSMTAQDERLLDTAKAIRDFIAHQSRGAKAAMNDKLASVTQGQHNRYLNRGTNKVDNAGSYLKAVFDGHRRIAIYAGRFKDIAARL